MAKPNGKPRERTSSITELADFAGVSRTAIYDWKKLPGFPIAADGSVSKWEMCEWCLHRLSGSSIETDSEMSAGESPELERVRRATADLKEMDVAERRGQVMSRELVHAKLAEIAGLIRGCGEQLQREYGDDALQILDQTLDDIDEKINEWSLTEASEDI